MRSSGVSNIPVMFIVLIFQWVFLPDPTARERLTLPPKVQVDYRAACFCHRNLIDIGYVCSVCLSSKYVSVIEILAPSHELTHNF